MGTVGVRTIAEDFSVAAFLVRLSIVWRITFIRRFTRRLRSIIIGHSNPDPPAEARN